MCLIGLAIFWPAGMLSGLPTSTMPCGIRVSAIFTTIGGKGGYRIAHALDFADAFATWKPVIGYSDITILRSSRHLYRSNRWNRETASSIGMSRQIEGSGGGPVHPFGDPKSGK
jgi:hypothetical protein